MKMGEILPIGTLININEGKNMYCIIGYYPTGKSEDDICDYVICNATYGIVGDQLGLVNKKDISDVVIKGYEDFTQKEFINYYKETMLEILNDDTPKIEKEGE